MACPFFIPSAPLAAGPAFPPPRLPLGDPYDGVCQALDSGPFQPPESILRDLCNCGYSRGRCRHFPASHPGDAVRFSVTADDEQGRVAMVYVIEQYHTPLEFGPLEYARSAWIGNPPPEPLASQARAFVESYLGRRTDGQLHQGIPVSISEEE